MIFSPKPLNLSKSHKPCINKPYAFVIKIAKSYKKLFSHLEIEKNVVQLLSNTQSESQLCLVFDMNFPNCRLYLCITYDIFNLFNEGNLDEYLFHLT